jgi:asparagine synthase (glutamine-hydrolysing)
MRPDRAEKLRASLDLDRSDSRDVYAIYRGLFSPAAVGGLMGDVAIAQNGSSTAANIPDRVNAVSYLEMSSYMRNVLLRDADVMSMAHSLELRVPFLDHRLVEYVAMLPGSVKLRRGVRKPLLVDALAADLPEPIRRERKRGFTLPFETWMQTDLRSEVDAVLLDSSRGGAIGERLDSREVGLVWRAFLAGKLHWSRPWALYVLKRWGELHTAV